MKTLIVTDTTSGLDFDSAKSHNIELVPLSVLIDGVEYKDHIDITSEELYNKLRDGAVPTTSQPNIGYVEEQMKKWKDANYDAIIIVTISSHLSGTYQGFKMMAEQLQMDNIHLVDSLSVAGPLLDEVLLARKLADEGKSTEEIIQALQKRIQNSISFLYPETLTQLKKGGRISPVAANMASLLKIKPLLMLKKDGTIIDKYGMSRTETKIFEMIKDALVKEKVACDTHCLYLAHAEAEAILERFSTYIKHELGDIEIFPLPLPAVLTSHGGLGCIAVQSTLK